VRRVLMGSMLWLRSPVARYGLALAVTALASLLRFLAAPSDADSDLTYFGFTLAILLAALVGGIGPGLLATGLSGFVSAYLLLAPIYSMHVASDERAARLILFLGEGVLLSFVGQVLHNAETADIDSSRLLRYVPALLFVLTATGLKLLVFTDLERAIPFTFFYAAVAASAWAGGLGPGLVATMLSSLAARYFFLVPRYSLAVNSPVNAERVTLFILEGILISGLSATYPKARRIASSAMEQVRKYARRMWKSMEDARALRLTTRDVIWEWDLGSNRMIRGSTEVDSHRTPTPTMTLGAWLQEVHPKDRSAVLSSINSTLKGRDEEWFCEYRRLGPGGQFAFISDHAYIFRDAAGNAIRLVGRSADLSESKRAARMFGSERQYRAVFEQNPLAILLSDSALHVIDANPAASDVLGYSHGQLIGMHVEKVVEERRRDAIMETLLGLTRAGRSAITLEEECVRANGMPFRAKINAAAISEVEKGSGGWVIMIENVDGA
jgi:PAS domain S-box-containing protein